MSGGIILCMCEIWCFVFVNVLFFLRNVEFGSSMCVYFVVLFRKMFCMMMYFIVDSVVVMCCVFGFDWMMFLFW